MDETARQIIENIAREIALDKNLCSWVSWKEIPGHFKRDTFYPLAARILALVIDDMEISDRDKELAWDIGSEERA